MRPLLRLAGLLALSVSLFSCDKDISEENGDLPGGNPQFVSQTCKLCRFIPMCDNSVYNYSDSSGGSATPFTFTLKFLKDTVIDGKTFQKFQQQPYGPTYYNCSVGVSTIVVINGSTGGGSSVPYLKLTLLRANDFPGATWSDTYDMGGGQTAIYRSTLLEKNIIRTVKGVTYPDVAHVRVNEFVSIPGSPDVATGVSDYYYAVGTGLIDATNTDLMSGQQLLHRVLLSASIP